MRAHLEGAESFVSNCSDGTKDQVKMILERLGDNLTEEQILTNLAENKKHVELKIATLKMDTASHDYMGYGTNLADLYLTLAATPQ